VTAPPNGGVGAAAKQVAEHASAIARLEAELAGLELKQKVAALGIGLGLVVGAALLALYAVGFLLATAAAGLATAMDTWLALLIVGLVLLLLTALLALFGVRSIKKGTPPVPKQAIHEAKVTAEAVKGNGGT
jgi:amino acid transporter